MTEDTFYTATPTAIQMAVHHPRQMLNPFKKGFTIKPCYNYFVYVSKVGSCIFNAQIAFICCINLEKSIILKSYKNFSKTTLKYLHILEYTWKI